MVRISGVIINESNNRGMKKILIFIFIMVLVGFGCKKAAVQDGDLLKTKWTLSCIQDTKTGAITNYPSDEKNKISIVFIDSLNVISISGICNGCTGTYSYSSPNGEINIVILGCTQVACKYDEWEGYTTQNLNTAFNYKINGNNLAIYSNGAYNLYFNQN
jgi:heat shock protein HslJ